MAELGNDNGGDYLMDVNMADSTYSQYCSCGKSFSLPGALKYHQRTCSRAKKRLAGVLTKAREAWNDRKKRRIEPVEHNHQDNIVLPDDDTKSDNCHQAVVHDTQMHQPGPVQDDNRVLIPHSRPRRLHRRLPKRFRDIIPEPLPLLPPTCEVQPDQPHSTSIPPEPTCSSSATLPLVSTVRRIFRTPRNMFGLFRQYLSDKLPSHDPEEYMDFRDLCEDSSASKIISPQQQRTELGEHKFLPYPNESSFRLGHWYWNHGIQKSRQSFRELLDIVGDPKFSPDDVRHTPWHKIDEILGRNDFDEQDEGDEAEWMDVDSGWKKTTIAISVPFHRNTKTPGPQTYVVGDLYHRSFVSVIREKLANADDNQHFHYEPFELFWRPTDTCADERVHGELYTSRAFLDAHRELQESPREPGCTLPRVVVAIMLWSDATHLTSFGDAKLWPCYLCFGNESKYRRCRPTNHLANHVAYFQSLPDSFKDFASQNMKGHPPSKQLMAHCRRELLHTQWEVLLDEEFLIAYKHGIVVVCCDGNARRFYPRLLTYSGDYKEKIILAGIRDQGLCPCPRCLIPKSRLQNMGMPLDMKQRKTLARVDDEARRRKVGIARDIIYKKNYAVDSDAVKAILKEESLVPNKNAFSTKLAPLGLDLYRILVVDLLHEVELGVWKALFIHLLRILNTVDKSLIDELDRRFRQVPTFGRDTIRRFSRNVSELKRMAARDFEDLLQCSIPAFEGLLPEPYNSSILRLLFVTAHWHGLAKLRMHTDRTLAIFEQTNIRIGVELRAFATKLCSAFDTKELAKEVKARQRRQQKNTQKCSGKDDSSNHKPTSAPKPSRDGPRRRRFNLQTYKYHSFGYYATTIRQLGTLDSFSTEPGELEHRKPKSRYRRTDKKPGFVKQLTRIERREARLRRIRARFSATRHDACEAMVSSPHEHHHIGVSQSHHRHIGTFLRENAGDPAIKNFLPELKEHILPRIMTMLQIQRQNNNPPGHDDSLQVDNISPESILFKSDRIYEHKLMRLNYTTYDVRRYQDMVNASTPHHNVMVLADPSDDPDSSSPHPFRYARVLGVYHANIIYVGPGMLNYQPHRLEFLWVRWYKAMETTRTGWDAQKLDRIQFFPVADKGAFGFINPSDVLRGCHLVPAFASGKRHPDGKGLSSCARDASDWVAYYVNRFVDRDMLMRYHLGLGVGHMHTNSQNLTSLGRNEQVPRVSDSNYMAGDEVDDILPPAEIIYHSNSDFEESDSNGDMSGSNESSEEDRMTECDQEDMECIAMYETNI